MLNVTSRCSLDRLLSQDRVVVKLLAGQGRLDVSGSDGPVSEPFAILALERVSLDHGGHDVHDLGLGDALLEGLVQSLTVVTSTEHHQVGSGSLSDKGDLGSPRSCTTL